MLTLPPFRSLPSVPQFAGNHDRQYAHLRLQDRAEQYGTGKYEVSRISADPYLKDIFSHFLQRNDIILELGCNSGNNLLPLGRIYRAYGVDLERMLVQKANMEADVQGLKHRVKAAQWDFAEDGCLPPEWPDLHGKCKAIYAVHVLSHFSEPALIDAIGKMKPYLAPGGIFVATIIDPPGADVSDSDAEFTPYQNFMRTHRRADTLAGFQSHRPSVVEQAFQGLRLAKEYSRPFKPGELVTWTLPESRLRWVVYQLEPDSANASSGTGAKKRKFSFSALMSEMRSRLGYWANRSES